MAIHVYACKYGHRIEMDEPANHEFKRLRCNHHGKGLGTICGARLVLSANVATAPPILKAGGVGGFYKPTRPERHSED